MTTTLAAIPKLHLSLECGLCGHHRLLPVAALLSGLDPETTVAQVARSARCQGCRGKGYGKAQVVYVGASEYALDGARERD
ncbi:hypothetical protein ACQ5SP_05430 [Rhodovulum sp. YNF3179]|uniref:hypothetical protein n=1 Tax=Rhodovulum sp. YNF3179 TaxID=3425127 RepID=UPI003D35848E